LPLPCGPTSATDRGFSPFLLLVMAAPPSFIEGAAQDCDPNLVGTWSARQEFSAKSTPRESL
jgi:hypothetical protein